MRDWLIRLWRLIRLLAHKVIKGRSPMKCCLQAGDSEIQWCNSSLSRKA